MLEMVRPGNNHQQQQQQQSAWKPADAGAGKAGLSKGSSRLPVVHRMLEVTRYH